MDSKSYKEIMNDLNKLNKDLDILIDELYDILYWQRLENIIKEGDKNADM